MLFPIQKTFILRNKETDADHRIRATEAKPVFGVKGKKALTDLISLPFCAPLDVRHLIYIGIAKTFLSFIVSEKLINISKLSNIIDSIKLPYFFRQKPKNLTNKLIKWKTQEVKYFLLYYGPFVFNELGNVEICSLYLMLSTSIYTLPKKIVIMVKN